ncbi:MAG: SCO family protein [Thiobacillus sp. 65-29]|nr:MAG: SCO family protein [Thiobacillus sp. 65-29]
MKAGIAVLACVALFGLAACQPQSPTAQFVATDITDAGLGGGFTLVDHSGRTVTLADFRGKAVAMFFGYTHCPDVCPTTLSDFAEAMRQLGPDAARVQVIFVSVDPQRDTPELMAQFVPAFDPSFLGAHAPGDELARLAKSFRVVYQKTAVKGPDDYLIDHSAGTYVFDPQGRLRLLMPYGSSPSAIVQDLRTLLAASAPH